MVILAGSYKDLRNIATLRKKMFPNLLFIAPFIGSVNLKPPMASSPKIDPFTVKIKQDKKSEV